MGIPSEGARLTSRMSCQSASAIATSAACLPSRRTTSVHCPLSASTIPFSHHQRSSIDNLSFFLSSCIPLVLALMNIVASNHNELQ
ncbi:hypothetical protein Syun_012403 [Stephania yunnanensis]|uniref:Uncharacterized protein n=1 Tax=Stephania yunnanensis TaxID=152371 RepID=A0AAP0PFA3_9MAGN